MKKCGRKRGGSWPDDWPSTQLWPPALLALNNVKQHHPSSSSIQVHWTLSILALHRQAATGWDIKGSEFLYFFFFFCRYLSKWAWERTVSSAVSQSAYRHGWLITEGEIYGYNEGENRTRAKSCCCAPPWVCLCCLMSQSQKSQEEKRRESSTKINNSNLSE